MIKKNKGFKNHTKTSIMLWNTEIGGVNLSAQNKVVKFKKRKSINIGIIVFVILFIYIAINVYLFFTKEQLTIYEVQEGTTAIDNRITGLILRKEKLISTDKSGFILYYQKDGARVAKDASIYSISGSEIYNTDNSDGATIVLSDKNQSEIRREIRTFLNSSSNTNYSQIYDFKDNAQSTVLDILNSSLVTEDQDAATGKGAVVSDKSGIITYYMDDFETVEPDEVTSDMFNKVKYKKTSLRTTDKIAHNTPVYKIITSEEWNLVLPLTKEQYDKLADEEKLKFTVLEDDTQITASMALIKKGSENYAVLTMSKDMANYLGERFLDIEINFESVDGLKIPNTSIVKKKFYEVPLTYFTKGGESKEDGLIVEVDAENGEITYPFVATDIYYQNKEYGYIDTQRFPVGTRIQLPKKADEYVLSKTKELTGVYNVNQGYAVFKRIEVLDKNDEYCIISDHTEKGLSAYDHIVLDGKIAVEQKIIY